MLLPKSHCGQASRGYQITFSPSVIRAVAGRVLLKLTLQRLVIGLQFGGVGSRLIPVGAGGLQFPDLCAKDCGTHYPNCREVRIISAVCLPGASDWQQYGLVDNAR